jgi:hypothetical protein
MKLESVMAMTRPVDQGDIHAALTRLGWPQAHAELWTRDERVAKLVRRQAGVQMVHVYLGDGASGWVLVRGGLDG